MKKIIFFLLLAVTGTAFAQKKITTSATVSFDAATKLDALPKAGNKTVIAAIDPKKGIVAFEAQIKAFNFSNAMMQEHFNSEKWLDSEKYPTASFKGKITNLNEVNFEKDGSYTAIVQGDLTIKGIAKPVAAKATIVVKGGIVTATSDFTIKLADYGISNAGGKLADEPRISVSAELK